MPKLTKQAYISKTLGSVSLPSASLVGWAVQRFIQLKMRHRIKVTAQRIPILKQKINDFFNNLINSADGIEGKFFWVTDHVTSHMGPCLFCLDQEAKFRNTGAPREVLERIMTSNPCLSWHWNSRLGPGVTYSRILNEDEANSNGIGIFGSQSPQGAGQGEAFVLTDAMRKKLDELILGHIDENKSIASQLTVGQLNREAATRKGAGQDISGMEITPKDRPFF